MRSRNIPFLMSLLIAGITTTASANWQYAGNYISDGWRDDGTRFVISGRGGFAWGNAKVKNGLSGLQAGYWYDETNQIAVTDAYYQCYISGKPGCADIALDGAVFAGYGDVGSLSAAEKFSKTSFAAGASIGFTVPNSPQWRIEAGWDHISETEYNASPLFDGQLALSGGEVLGVVVSANLASVQSKLTTDIFSAMAFYDFYTGIQKPLRTIIPYVGFGVGYAISQTQLNVYDNYGDLSSVAGMAVYGETGEDNIISFYQSSTDVSNFAALAALGMSYGIYENVFLDLGVRATYLPKIAWQLSNSDGTIHRDLFSIKNTIYTDVMFGLRIEF